MNVSQSIAAGSGSFSGSGAEVYRSLSRAAVASAALAVLGLAAFVAVQMLLLPILGLICGLLGLKAIRRYPEELTGRPAALLGIGLSLTTLVGAISYHAYVYATEVPEGYTRIQFGELASTKGQPDVPTAEALKWNGQRVFVKGYVHPSSMASASAKKFILVPDLGTCCFGGQPPLTHMIEVNLTGDQYAHRNFRKKGLAGTFSVTPYLKPIEGLTGVYYQLQADVLR
ncbi:MAG: DUF3299 domain-containing protein [Pirellulaceae bacterium]|nr:DUF3299 domain-containing protein [Pirellulaceae bacterium]